MDDKKIVYGVAGLSMIALGWQTWRLHRINLAVDEFVTVAKESVDALYQIAVDVEFEDITRDLDI